MDRASLRIWLGNFAEITGGLDKKRAETLLPVVDEPECDDERGWKGMEWPPGQKERICSRTTDNGDQRQRAGHSQDILPA